MFNFLFFLGFSRIWLDLLGFRALPATRHNFLGAIRHDSLPPFILLHSPFILFYAAAPPFCSNKKKYPYLPEVTLSSCTTRFHGEARGATWKPALFFQGRTA